MRKASNRYTFSDTFEVGNCSGMIQQRDSKKILTFYFSLCFCHSVGRYLPLPKGICRKASCELWTGFRLLPSVFWLPCCGGVPSRLRLGPSGLRRAPPRRAPRRDDFCLLFSTGWVFIVRAALQLCSAELFIPLRFYFHRSC